MTTNQQLICPEHPQYFIHDICLQPFCSYKTFLCHQCIKEDIVHYKAHREHIVPVKQFLQEGKE